MQAVFQQQVRAFLLVESKEKLNHDPRKRTQRQKKLFKRSGTQVHEATKLQRFRKRSRQTELPKFNRQETKFLDRNAETLR